MMRKLIGVLSSLILIGSVLGVMTIITGSLWETVKLSLLIIVSAVVIIGLIVGIVYGFGRK